MNKYIEAPEFEYQIGSQLYKTILDTKTKEDKMDDKDYVMNVINTEFNIWGTVTELHVID